MHAEICYCVKVRLYEHDDLEFFSQIVFPENGTFLKSQFDIRLNSEKNAVSNNFQVCTFACLFFYQSLEP